MDLNSLKSFATESRRQLLKTVSLKIEYVLSENSTARRENPQTIIELENKIISSSKENITEEVSYTWFNRFIALQYMDLNGFNDVQVIIPSKGRTRPEILSNAISGVFDNSFISDKTQNVVSSLLDGRRPSSNPENEVYKLLLVSYCNKFNSMMPFLFERIADYTELLIPDDLLSNKSILAKVRNVLTKENCQNVEVLGWLYQFYISEKKEEVFSNLRKNKKIISEDIPAATQLFTPNWIVKYLVENSLGRLWMLNNPNSNLINQMDYYIDPIDIEKDFLEISSPEDIKICDPACGSGHILTYTFDILYSIYEEEGYSSDTIPYLILKNNLYGIELDKRAGDLSAFALSIKARERDNNFHKKSILPNICVLENINFKGEEINEYMNEIGRDLFTNTFQTTLKQFEECKNFGSLIQPLLQDLDGIEKTIKLKNLSSNLFLNPIHMKVLNILNQVKYLSNKYHILIANPPYMGSNGMNNSLSIFAKNNYPDSKSDLFGMFIERALNMTKKNGIVAMVSMQSWMFLTTFEKLRMKILSNSTILNMAHIGSRGFDTIGGEVVTTTAFLLQKKFSKEFQGEFLRLIEGRSELEKSEIIKTVVKSRNCSYFFRISSSEFAKIPGSPIIYWCSDKIRNTFSDVTLGTLLISDGQTITGKNEKYIRFIWEVNHSQIGKKEKWVKHPKGGEFRKWYGNLNSVVDWSEAARKHYRTDKIARILPEYLWWKKGVCWSLITSTNQSYRLINEDEIFNKASPTLFVKDQNDLEIILAFLNTKVSQTIIRMLNPTINTNVRDIQNLPIIKNIDYENVRNKCKAAIDISKTMWDSYETSYEFKVNSILSFRSNSKTFKDSYKSLRNYWKESIDNLMNLEVEINNIFISAYELESELIPQVPLDEITLNCNPYYRYTDKLSEKNLEERLLKDTIKEFISYSVGCMFGRYSLDKQGYVLSDYGENLKDYLKRIPNPSFLPDEDNIIPILDLDWFEDDITARFKKFLRITFGDENFEENLRFIENNIGKNIRKYFLNDFYKDHLGNYKKRPIYWMFSSPKGSFNALIYIHRYQKDTVSILLENYLREFLLKLRAEKNNLERFETNNNYSSGEKNKAINEIQKIDNIISELQNWIKEVIFPLASQRLEIELDDGVKFNYQKFGSALKKTSGLN